MTILLGHHGCTRFSGDLFDLAILLWQCVQSCILERDVNSLHAEHCCCGLLDSKSL